MCLGPWDNELLSRGVDHLYLKESSRVSQGPRKACKITFLILISFIYSFISVHVSASWLLAGDCWLGIPCLWMAQGKQEACRMPRESFRRARDGSRRVPRWLPGAFERVPGAMGGPWEGSGGSGEDQPGVIQRSRWPLEGIVVRRLIIKMAT